MTMARQKIFSGPVKQVDVKDFFFPSSGYSLEISKDIEPFEWDLFPEFGDWYASRSENLGLEFDGLNVSLVYDYGSSKDGLWTGSKYEVKASSSQVVIW